MKINKKILGLLLSGIMVFGVGCNKSELADELILENIENTVERNIEEYDYQYDTLTINEQTFIDWAKGIDFNKSKCEIKELRDKYEIKLILRAEYDYAIGNDDVYTLVIDKDDFKEIDLKATNLIYDNRIKVVAIEGYCGNECVSNYKGRKDDYKILDSDVLKDDMLLFLGDINVLW